MKTVKKIFNPRPGAYGLFWSWNIIFLAFMVFGFAPNLLPEMLAAVKTGIIPAEFLVYGVVLVSIPVVTVGLGAIRLRREPARLFVLGYGVEGPLMLGLALRFFVLRQATPAAWLLFGVAALGIATLLWQLLDKRIDQRGPAPAWLRLAGLALLLVAGLYAGVWLAFYAVPLAGAGWNGLAYILGNFPQFLREFGRALHELFTGAWRAIPFALLGITLMIYTATLLVLLPAAIPIIYVREWWRGVQAFRYRRAWAVLLTLLVLALTAGLFVAVNRQPQAAVFALLENPPASPTQARALLAQQNTIRAGLLNAFLAPHRYVSAVGEVRHIRDIYRDTFDMPAAQAARVQAWYEAVARPILYQPVHPAQPNENRWDNVALRQESQEAAKLYAAFFDQPIIEGERTQIVRAVRSTWQVDQAQAAWQAVDDREVYLARQELTVTEHGDWAEFELYEVYQNQTTQRQEVVYYFSLPESAVVTGVWLGHSANRSQRFEYRVSPRGAAQELYRTEVRRRIDPALVEQIGPRQYRLRAFPIEPQQVIWGESSRSANIEEAPPLHLWLTWRALAQNGVWPLPQLAELRNVYWNADSVRLVNQQPLVVAADRWLPAALPPAQAVQPVAHRYEFPGGQAVLAQPANPAELPALPTNLRLAVVLDRSRSMAAAAAADAVKTALAHLAHLDAAIDVYLTASKFRGEAPAVVGLAQVNPENILYFGGQNAAELLAQFEALHTGPPYDAILVLTDGTGYQLVDPEVQVSTPTAPVWMVHLDGNLPLGYDDATLEALQASGGGVTGSLAEALTRLAVARSPLAATADVIDGYVWTVAPANMAGLPVERVSAAPAEDGFAPLAARRLILGTMQQNRGRLDQLENLDQLHAIAIENSIVTPYSSMIVLVTDEQQRRLEWLEQGSDRFEREHEAVGDTMPDDQFTVTGVPEPEEWLLMALAATLLGWYMWRARRPALFREN